VTGATDRAALIGRLLSRVATDRRAGCWLWQGALDGGGYGVMSVGGKTARVHRLAAWLWLDLPLASRLVVNHLCDTRRCLNPAHLAPGSQSDNLRQAVARGRFNRHLRRLATMGMPEEHRLLLRREISAAGCWEWQGSRDKDGYGRVRLAGKMWRVHRLAATRWLGLAQGSDLVVAHACDNPACFNPAHLTVTTQWANVHDAFDKGRRSGRKLSEQQVSEILRRLGAGEKARAIAAELGISPATISNIVHGREWRHITAAAAAEQTTGDRTSSDPQTVTAKPVDGSHETIETGAKGLEPPTCAFGERCSAN
jgi:helix-turn-helix protein